MFWVLGRAQVLQLLTEPLALRKHMRIHQDRADEGQRQGFPNKRLDSSNMEGGRKTFMLFGGIFEVLRCSSYISNVEP